MMNLIRKLEMRQDIRIVWTNFGSKQVCIRNINTGRFMVINLTNNSGANYDLP